MLKRLPMIQLSIMTLCGLLVLGGCSLAPKYHAPETLVPVTYKEAGTWAPTKPSIIDRGPWWQMYHDSVLTCLEEKVSFGNQNIKAAMARYDQAHAALTVARSYLYPTINAVFNANTQRTSTNIPDASPKPTFQDFIFGASLSYEVDLWGRIRNQIVAAKSQQRASAADLAAIELSLHAELATDYFSLRGADRAQQILDKTVSVYQKALYYVNNRFKGGVASAADVAQAKNLLESAKTLAADNHMRRAQLEHAIAILTGEPPGMFSLPVVKHWKAPVIVAATDLPSTLLERRPDIASAEETARAANAYIGVARAAFFPQVNLAAGIGFESSSLSKLFNPGSLVYFLGPIPDIRGLETNAFNPLVNQLIFDGGRTYGMTKQAWGRYYEAVANYRQIVLTAFREVEDSLIALRELHRENQTQSAAALAAQQAFQQSVYRYKGGIAFYLDIVYSENIALQSELSAVNIQTLQHTSSVALIRALGGGYHQCPPPP